MKRYKKAQSYGKLIIISYLLKNGYVEDNKYINNIILQTNMTFNKFNQINKYSQKLSSNTSYNVTVGIIKILNQLYKENKIYIDNNLIDIITEKIKKFPHIIHSIKFLNKNQKKNILSQFIEINPKILIKYKRLDDYFNHQEFINIINELLTENKINEYDLADFYNIKNIMKDIYLTLILTNNKQHLIPKYIYDLKPDLELLKNIYADEKIPQFSDKDIIFKSPYSDIAIIKLYYGLNLLVASINNHNQIKTKYGIMASYYNNPELSQIAYNYANYVENLILDK